MADQTGTGRPLTHPCFRCGEPDGNHTRHVCADLRPQSSTAQYIITVQNKFWCPACRVWHNDYNHACRLP